MMALHLSEKARVRKSPLLFCGSSCPETMAAAATPRDTFFTWELSDSLEN
jgi:hypothetical protein